MKKEFVMLTSLILSFSYIGFVVAEDSSTLDITFVCGGEKERYDFEVVKLEAEETGSTKALAEVYCKERLRELKKLMFDCEECPFECKLILGNILEGEIEGPVCVQDTENIGWMDRIAQFAIWADPLGYNDADLEDIPAHICTCSQELTLEGDFGCGPCCGNGIEEDPPEDCDGDDSHCENFEKCEMTKKNGGPCKCIPDEYKVVGAGLIDSGGDTSNQISKTTNQRSSRNTVTYKSPINSKPEITICDSYLCNLKKTVKALFFLK